MNPSQWNNVESVRTAINETINAIRPNVMGSPGLNEETRTLLVNHLDHLLQLERSLLTPENVSTNVEIRT